MPAEKAGPLARYAATIQAQRGDYNGRVLSIRQDDLRTLAVIYDEQPSVLAEQLISWGVLNAEARRAFAETRTARADAILQRRRHGARRRSARSAVARGELAADRGRPAATSPTASPMRWTRIALVEPGMPGGLPATMTTWSPVSQRPMSSSAASTWRTMSSVCATGGTRKVSTPQVSASWLRTRASGVKASSGIGER